LRCHRAEGECAARVSHMSASAEWQAAGERPPLAELPPWLAPSTPAADATRWLGLLCHTRPLQWTVMPQAHSNRQSLLAVSRNSWPCEPKI
ncbi:mCG145037, partial [Mus musculus]